MSNVKENNENKCKHPYKCIDEVEESSEIIAMQCNNEAQIDLIMFCIDVFCYSINKFIERKTGKLHVFDDDIILGSSSDESDESLDPRPNINKDESYFSWKCFDELMQSSTGLEFCRFIEAQASAAIFRMKLIQVMFNFEPLDVFQDASFSMSCERAVKDEGTAVITHKMYIQKSKNETLKMEVE